MAKSNFYRLNYVSISDLDVCVRESRLSEDAIELASKVKVGNFILAARYNHDDQWGEVRAVGRVTRVERSVEVNWRAAHFNVCPTGNGAVHWRKDHFGFAVEVAKRYDLAAQCAGVFPEAFSVPGTDEAPSANSASVVSAGASPQSDSGHVYVVKSPYGYKIGKSKNLRERTRMFGVKLPFPIEVVLTGWYEDYSEAEIRFHQQFAHKRLEGEWFDLSQTDLDVLGRELRRAN
jgi:hypothetical protein